MKECLDCFPWPVCPCCSAPLPRTTHFLSSLSRLTFSISCVMQHGWRERESCPEKKENIKTKVPRALNYAERSCFFGIQRHRLPCAVYIIDFSAAGVGGVSLMQLRLARSFTTAASCMYEARNCIRNLSLCWRRRRREIHGAERLFILVHSTSPYPWLPDDSRSI